MNHSSKLVLMVVLLPVLAACNDSTPTSPNGQLVVEPATVALVTGGAAQFTALDEGGAPVTQGVAWSSSDPRVLSIDSNGMATTGYEVGSATISARVGSRAGEANAVVAGLCANSVSVTGEPGTNAAGDQTFDVRLDGSLDVARIITRLEAQIGFKASETFANGFEASLTTGQLAQIVCRAEVVSVAYA